MIIPKVFLEKKISGIGSELESIAKIDLVIVGKCSFRFASAIYKEICPNVSSISLIEPYLTKEGTIGFLGGLCEDLNLGVCLLVHAVCDTGFVHHETQKRIASEFPRAIIKTICMVNKLPNRQFDYDTDFSIINLDRDAFVVGYGIGIDNEYRDLDHIYELYD